MTVARWEELLKDDAALDRMAQALADQVADGAVCVAGLGEARTIVESLLAAAIYAPISWPVRSSKVP